jgi:helicase
VVGATGNRVSRSPDDAFLLLDGIRKGDDPYEIVATMELRDDER